MKALIAIISCFTTLGLSACMDIELKHEAVDKVLESPTNPVSEYESLDR